MTDPERILAALGGTMMVALMVQNGQPLARMIEAVSVLAGARCPHCGYRLDHPIVRHGPPCLARDGEGPV